MSNAVEGILFQEDFEDGVANNTGYLRFTPSDGTIAGSGAMVLAHALA
mgnify:CR=1 FL=1